MKALHKIADIAGLGLHSLLVHVGRSALTALGIVFAVWSVIAMLAINKGLSYEAQQKLRELGSDNIIVESVKPPQSVTAASGQNRGALVYGLTWTDVARLRDNIPGVVRCAIAHRTQKHVRVGARSLPVSVIATEPIYARVARTDIVAGRFFSASDAFRRKPYCVLTAELARKLLPAADPLGKTVILNDEPFIVIGLLERLPRALAGAAAEGGHHVLIPLSTDRLRFGEFTVMQTKGSRSYEKVEVSQIVLQMTTEKAVIQGAAIARSLLARHHEQEDYQVTVPAELLEQLRAQRRQWNVMFLAIASISLIVGGIGIMNIMLASVTERTREIGIRRALGAKRRDIVTQFLVESITLTTLGGLLGIGIGLLVPRVVEWVLQIKTIVTPLTLLLPLAMAVAVGMVAGLYPALRAARLDPINALRHE